MAPELAALPWELLYDPEREHGFATANATLWCAISIRRDAFGALTEQGTGLPTAHAPGAP